ncbi:MAG: DUF58 domain-containing protein [Candidatus Omnitrophica bacterium]|nr:DUF58 domain-containing protein [Candidatus Omnitrophota bacterium]
MRRLLIKRWLFLGFIILANLFIALKTGADFFYFSFLFLTALVCIDYLWLFITYYLAELHIEQRSPKRTEEGQFIKVEVSVKNQGLLSLGTLVLESNLACEVEEKRLERLALEYLPVGSTRTVSFSGNAYKRGRYDIGPCRVYFFDPLNLFFFQQTFPVYSEIYVYPKTFHIPRFPSLIKGVMPWFGIDTTHVSGDDDEFFGVREYRLGDPIKRMHWFSSAKHNRLIVRQFQRQSFFRATILFTLNRNENFGEGKEKVEEYIVKIAASVAKYLLEKGCAVEILAHIGEAVHIPSNKGGEHLESILKFLAMAQANSTITMIELLEGFSRFIPNDSNLIIIALDTEWDNLMRTIPLRSRNISVIPLILLSSSFLHSFGAAKILTETKMKLLDTVKLTPLFFLKGENPEEAFLKY